MGSSITRQIMANPAVSPRHISCNSTGFPNVGIFRLPTRPMAVQSRGDYGVHVACVHRTGRQPNPGVHPGDIR
jgi:hypothetical protein